MTDCVYFQTLIKELNPSDSNSGDCCTWDMVGCDDQGNIVKLDFSNYQGITTNGAFPQTVAFLTHLKEFSIRGQTSINDIYSLSTENLEKVDLSNSGMSSQNFPTWLYDAPNLKEIDISSTQITGIPQREFKSQISGCNFSNTPICSSYESSPFSNYIPDICKSSCTNGATGNFSNNSVNNDSGSKKSGTKIWPFILIGVAALLIIGLLAFLLLRKGGKKKDKKLAINYEEDSPKPILPVSNKNNKKEDAVEITVNDKVPVSVPVVAPKTTQTNVPTTTVASSVNPVTPVATTPIATAAAATAAAVSIPQAAAVVKHDPNDKRIEEVARNNYSSAYGGDAKKNVFNNNRASGASVKDIYRQHNVSMSFDQDQSIMPHPSIYNTMTTDNDSDDDEISDIINEPIIAALDLKNENKANYAEKTPTLLRRKSSRKNNVNAIKENPDVSYEEEDTTNQESEELFIANWDYAPTLSDELALVAGDVIEIKKKFDDGWCTGYNRRTNQTGIVPLCYLKEYED